MGAAEQRELIRRAVLARRDAILPADREEWGQAIRRRFWTLPDLQGALVLHLSLSIGSEVPTDELIAEARGRGLRVVVPVTLVADRRLLLSEFPGPDAMVTGPFGIREPRPDRRMPVDVTEVDLLVIPGVAFDPEGHRLGWGAGFYDRLLAGAQTRVPIVALAYECQMVPAIPTQEHDVRVSIIVTEGRIIRPEHDPHRPDR